ncbi:MAG: aspartate aminotransferase family protein [Planctomycetaceae bacterium]|nr:aspartate aminotransferase family protein [Planctomycetaceae bacterium]
MFDAVDRLRGDCPYHHPLYLGQMLKPPHPIAQLAYTLAMSLNPNNHAYDGGRASSEMEKESVTQLAEMFGWSQHLGHLTSGGTIANFEALWVARELTDSGPLFASEHAHYTHERLSRVLGIPFQKVRGDAKARMDLDHLEQLLKSSHPGTVVATIGTTAFGSVDPLPEIIELCRTYGFRLHADAAYGGYYRLVGGLSEETTRAYEALSDVDSLVVDPHKHGLQPYGCGCVLFQDPDVGRIYRHDSPYTYFTSEKLHLGEISLECSRAGAAAVALWTTMRCFPPTPGGDFAAMLSCCWKAARKLSAFLRSVPELELILEPELDLVVWAVRESTASTSSERAREFFQKASERNLHLALANVPRSLAENRLPRMHWDKSAVTCLRSCLMKPEHLANMPRILDRFQCVLAEFRGS